MLLRKARMIDRVADAFSPATVLFANTERSMLAVVPGAAALIALPLLPEMIESVTFAYVFGTASCRPSKLEPVIVTFFSEATLKPPELERKIPKPLSVIVVSAMYKNIDAPPTVMMPVMPPLERKL